MISQVSLHYIQTYDGLSNESYSQLTCDVSFLFSFATPNPSNLEFYASHQKMTRLDTRSTPNDDPPTGNSCFKVSHEQSPQSQPFTAILFLGLIPEVLSEEHRQ